MDQVYLAASLNKIIYLEFCYHLCYLDLLSLNRHLLQKKTFLQKKILSFELKMKSRSHITTKYARFYQNVLAFDRCNKYVIVHFHNVCNISFSTNNRVLTIDLLNRRRSICKVLLRLSSMNLLGFHMKIYVRCMFLFEDHPLLELTFSTEVTANLN